MTEPVQLYTSLSEFETLRAQEDAPRANARVVKVDRQALDHMLMDHSRMVRMLKERGLIEVTD